MSPLLTPCAAFAAAEIELRNLEFELYVLGSVARYIADYAADQQTRESLKTLQITEHLLDQAARRMEELHAMDAERVAGTKRCRRSVHAVAHSLTTT